VPETRQRTVYYTASSMDGYIADPDDSLDWLFSRDQDLEGPLNYDAFIADVGALVMGRTTYEWVLRHEGAKPDFTWPYSQPCWVMTHADLEAVADTVRFAHGDVRQVHGEMLAAADDRDVWVVGGGDLAGQFTDAGLLDEVVVYYAPVALGAGRPLLPRHVELETLEVARNRDFLCARFAVVKEPGAA
jgi:dihydrofolate reductase